MGIEVIQKIKDFIYSRKFNKKQIKEIEFGMVEGLDTKYYAKKYFDEYQMREIRYGLEEGLDVKNIMPNDLMIVLR